MLHLRTSLLRALPISASSASSSSVAARNSRSFVSIVNASPSTCSSRLPRPQRAAIVLQSLRRAYASGEEARDRLEKAGESVSETAGKLSSEAKQAAEEGKQSTENFADAARQTAQSATETIKDKASQALGRAANAVGSSAGAAETGTLYVGNLFFESTEDQIREEFERFGSVNSVKIIKDGRGLSKGFGYVEMDPESAASARQQLDGETFGGRRIVVQPAVPRAPRIERRDYNAGPTNPPSKTLFIGNMSYEMTDRELNDMFKTCKDVVDVRVAVDRRTGQPRGFAHADFTNVESAQAAAEMLNGSEYHGRRLRIDYSERSSGR